MQAGTPPRTNHPPEALLRRFVRGHCRPAAIRWDQSDFPRPSWGSWSPRRGLPSERARGGRELAWCCPPFREPFRRGHSLTSGSNASQLAVSTLWETEGKERGRAMAAGTPPRTNHPPEALLRRFVRGTASRNEVRQVVAHLLGQCARCSRVVVAECPLKGRLSPARIDDSLEVKSVL